MKTPNLTVVGGTARKKMPRALRLDELMALPSPSYLIRQRLPQRGLVFVYGPPKSGKTFLVCDICMSLARGTDWHGNKATPAGVLYVAGEGASGLGIRMRAYARRHGMKPHTHFRAVPAAVALHETIDEIEAELEAIRIEHGSRPDVLVMDTQARTKGQLDEKTDSMAAYVQAADHFIAKGMLVIVIHHPGKDEEKGLRGWSGLLGALDVQIQVTQAADGTCVAKWTHIKDGAKPEPFAFRLDVVETGETDNFGDPVTSCVVVPTDMPAETDRAHPVGSRQKLLYSLLGEAMKASGDAGKGGAPAGRPCVRIDAVTEKWRDAVDGRAGEPQYMRRTLEPLVEKRLVATDGEWLWTP